MPNQDCQRSALPWPFRAISSTSEGTSCRMTASAPEPAMVWDCLTLCIQKWQLRYRIQLTSATAPHLLPVSSKLLSRNLAPSGSRRACYNLHPSGVCNEYPAPHVDGGTGPMSNPHGKCRCATQSWLGGTNLASFPDHDMLVVIASAHARRTPLDTSVVWDQLAMHHSWVAGLARVTESHVMLFHVVLTQALLLST